MAAAPGGIAVALAKRALEHTLWTRVRWQRAVEGWSGRGGPRRPMPSPLPPSDILSTRTEWEAAVRQCRRLRLPLHHDRPKNWDALGALATVLAECGTGASVLDAGCARYSSVLPWLRLYGLDDLVGNNLEYAGDVRRDGVLFRYGDITATDFADGRFDAVTCLSVIEHGVPLEPFLTEAARILRPGGVLVLSTDYDAEPRAVAGQSAYGQPVHVFAPSEVTALVALAGRHGLDLLGELRLDHAERPVHWRRTGLDFTFLRLSFRRR